jgi:hypothetical protein
MLLVAKTTIVAMMDQSIALFIRYSYFIVEVFFGAERHMTIKYLLNLKGKMQD